MSFFKIFKEKHLIALVKKRDAEIKLGERTSVASDEDISNSLRSSKAKYVLIGISEDIGVKGNFGIGGADSTWIHFLKAFLNTQSNDFLNGSEVLLLGHFDFSKLKESIEENNDGDSLIHAYRKGVSIIDDEVEKIVREITIAGKIPIVIGGGHNNSYPLLKGVANGLYQRKEIDSPQINCINLDAQTDLRPLEGRHSGNGFSYAIHEGFLKKYFIVGLHEMYMQQRTVSSLKTNNSICVRTFEEIFLKEKISFTDAVSEGLDFIRDNYFGIEFDVDSIRNVLSSAITPSGISELDARRYIFKCAKEANAAYLHICEAAEELEDGRKQQTIGKLLSYFVFDFIKSNSEKVL